MTMKLYELTERKLHNLVSITTDSGYTACCNVKRMLELYNTYESYMKLHGNIKRVVFYDHDHAFPLESDDWSMGFEITSTNFVRILNGIKNTTNKYQTLNDINFEQNENCMPDDYYIDLINTLQRYYPEKYADLTVDNMRHNYLSTSLDLSNLRINVVNYLDALMTKECDINIFKWLLYLWSKAV